jgi:hypothetical protein
LGVCAAVLAAAGGACSEQPTPEASPATLANPVAGQPPILNPDNAAQANQQLQSTSAPSQQIVQALKAALQLNDSEAACLSTRLDHNPDLRDALGDNPTASPRYQEVVDLGTDCVRTTTGATNFANGIAAQAPSLPVQTIACLRDGYAALSNQDVQAIVQNGLTPDSINTEAQAKLDDLLNHCNVDRTQLPAPPGAD